MAEPPTSADAAAEDPPESGPAVQDVKDHPRGYTGWVYEDVFKDLYQPAPAEEEPPPAEEAAEGEAGVDEPPTSPAASATHEDHEIDLTGEDDEIAAIHASVAEEQVRISEVVQGLKKKQEIAVQQDRSEAKQLQEGYGLLRREQVPVPDSTLRHILDTGELGEEGLIVPRAIMEPGEREIEIKKGTIPMHDNKLAVSKPDEPNHYRHTASLRIREQNRNIQPKYTEAQRQAIAHDLEERRRVRAPMPPGLSAEEREKNRKIVKRMEMKVAFLKNPRSLADRNAATKGEPCPFWFAPDQVVFRNYEVGAVYEMMVEFRNVTKIGRRLRVTLSSGSPSFSITPLWLQGAEGTQGHEATSVVAPGMAAYLTVRFAPTSLGEETEWLNVCTELGDYRLPVLARRVQPILKYEEPVNCGCTLAGTSSMQTVRLTNEGGEGSFRLVVPSEEEGSVSQYHYETDDQGLSTFVSETFQVSPASFYLEAGSYVDLQVRFAADEVGRHRCALRVECDNGESTPLTLDAITDAVRLELKRWPGRQHELTPKAPTHGVSPWALVPWQLNWLGSSAQVGGVESQEVVISNGGYLPIKAEWRLALPPRALCSRLSVGAQQRLTEDLVADIHNWDRCLPGSATCPFEVSPADVMLEPFSQATFKFTFHARTPVGHRSAAFAYLVAKELPSRGGCLLHIDELLALQSEMCPETYRPSLPLFGGAGGGALFEDAGGTAKCTISAVCLQGVSAPPTVTCIPRLLSFSGDVLPYLAHSREILLRNTGTRPARFRVRLSSSPTRAEGPLWVVSDSEAGKQIEPELPETDEDHEKLGYVARCLQVMRPKLPPQGGSPEQPGFGKLGSALVEPHEGLIPQGGSVKLRVTIRVLSELDLKAQLTVDLLGPSPDAPPIAPPLKVALAASVKAPRVELRRTSFIDYGVVRAHSRHTAKLFVDNPTDLPMMVRLRHHKEEEADVPLPTFPVTSHSEVVDVFTNRMSTHTGRRASFPDGGAAILSEDAHEAHVEPWVRARSSCMDFSGRRRYTVAGLADAGEGEGVGADAEEDGLHDDVDFVFKPACVVLWPRSGAEVEVSLRTGEPGKFRALLEAVGFDSGHTQFIEVYAEVQLPRLRLSTQHAQFEVTYLKTASQEFALALRNDSDMPAPFHWAWPRQGEEPLEVILEPLKGTVPPRSSMGAKLVVVPNREATLAELPCKLFVSELMHPLILKVSAQVFGSEIDYAIVKPGELPPEITHLPRKLVDGICPTFEVLNGKAPKSHAGLEFGQMELQTSKSLQLVLYNRTGIATQFSAKVARNPAHDPSKVVASPQRYSKTSTAAPAPSPHLGEQQLASAAALDLRQSSRQTFSSAPQPAGAGRMEEDPMLRLDPSNLQSPPPLLMQAKGAGKGTTPMHSSRGVTKFEPASRINSRGYSPRGTLLSKKSTGKRRRFLLDDKHEKQAFRSAVGADFAKAKELREQGQAALTAGRGYAVTVEPAVGMLKPFGRAIVNLTCFSDLPGSMEDDLVLSVTQLKGHDAGGFRVPMHLQSSGSPLYLPDQQVGLDVAADPPRLLCGTLVPAEKMSQRVFKVGNNSAAKMRISWKVYGQTQVDDTGESRQFVSVALCKTKADAVDPFALPKLQQQEDEDDDEDDDDDDLGLNLAGTAQDDDDDDEPFKFQMWGSEPPTVKDPFELLSGELPLRIEPEEAIVPVHGSVTFTVTMLASKATTGPGGHYRYKLVGKGRFTEDRDALLAAATEATQAAALDNRTRAPAAARVQDPRASQVQNLPNYDAEDSDEESEEDAGKASLGADRAPSAAPWVPSPDPMRRPQSQPADADGARKPLAEEPEKDVVSTIVVECVGDCIRPRLTVDKKAHPLHEEFAPQMEIHGEAEGKGPVHVPVFKFTHAAVVPTNAPSGERHQAGGAQHGGMLGGMQAPGVVSCLMRQITLINQNACNVPCRFRVEGPFRIQEISQVGQHPVRALEASKTRKKPVRADREEESPLIRLFHVPKLDTIALKVEFVPDMVPPSGWVDSKSEHIFEGDLIVEYPSEVSELPNPKVPTDLQRIKLQATSRRPAVRVVVVPNPGLDRPLRIEKADRPPWSEPEPVIVEFGYVHVQGSVSRRRVVLLSNITNNLAKWALLHVGRKRRPPHEIGVTLREDEEFRALDDKDAFEFDCSSGELRGPSKDGLMPGSDQRMPRWCPITPALPKAVPEADEHLYDPQKITITFKPKKNELYRCRFRIMVEQGKSVDFECRGCGSYDEEDDETDFQEA